jgi:hypothetical protein
LSEVFEEQYEMKMLIFLSCWSVYGGNRETGAQAMVLNQYGFIQSSPMPERMAGKYDGSLNVRMERIGRRNWGKCFCIR